MGAVIEKAAHKTFGEFLEEKIFAPLGMKDTGFFVPEEKQRRLAKAYERMEDNSLVPYEGSFLGIRNRMDRPAAYESGGAGLVSTIEDYALFAGMLLKGKR
ncbi:MAG: serine hydrolase domain-containing protein [Eisenbergiella sp.]